MAAAGSSVTVKLKNTWTMSEKLEKILAAVVSAGTIATAVLNIAKNV